MSAGKRCTGTINDPDLSDLKREGAPSGAPFLYFGQSFASFGRNCSDWAGLQRNAVRRA